jgi:outer membrane protein TolC
LKKNWKQKINLLLKQFDLPSPPFIMKKLIFLFTISLFYLPLLAQEKLSLSQAIEYGIQHNYQVEIAKQRLQIANNNNNWGAANRYPRVDLNINSQNGYSKSKNPGFLIEQSSLNAGLTPSIDANWTIYDGKKVKITKRQLEEVAHQGTVAVSEAIENTTQTIILAYNRALIQEEQLKTLQEVLLLSRDRVDYQDYVAHDIKPLALKTLLNFAHDRQ